MAFRIPRKTMVPVVLFGVLGPRLNPWQWIPTHLIKTTLGNRPLMWASSQSFSPASNRNVRRSKMLVGSRERRTTMRPTRKGRTLSETGPAMPEFMSGTVKKETLAQNPKTLSLSFSETQRNALVPASTFRRLSRPYLVAFPKLSYTYTKLLIYYRLAEINVRQEGETRISPIENFDHAGLHPAMRRNVELAGYNVPTPIQMYCLPAIVQGFDVMGIAQTGTCQLALILLVLHICLAWPHK